MGAAVGDLIWVRETCTYRPPVDVWLEKIPVQYHADDAVRFCSFKNDSLFQPGKRPSVHMHRWACRLMYRITDLYLEPRGPVVDDAEAHLEGFESPAAFFALWETLHPDARGPVVRVAFEPVALDLEAPAHGILFRPEMVRALLSGQKRVTRRTGRRWWPTLAQAQQALFAADRDLELAKAVRNMTQLGPLDEYQHRRDDCAQVLALVQSAVRVLL